MIRNGIKVFWVLSFLWAFSGSSFSAEAPAIQLPGPTGTVNLEDYKGKVVLVDFWASWCGPCRQSFPWMNQMLNAYGDHGLVIIAVNLDKDRALADKFLAENPANFMVAFDPDGKTPSQYGVKGMPNSFVVNRDGEIVATHIGFQSAKRGEYETSVRQALSHPASQPVQEQH